jgi:hypothetical protein
MCMRMLLIKFQPRKSKVVVLLSILCDHYSIALAFYHTCLVDTSDWPRGSSGTAG